MAGEQGGTLMRLTGEIVVSYVGHNQVAVADLPAVINAVAGSLSSLGPDIGKVGRPGGRDPRVQRSVTQDYIVCLEDGRRLRTLKRHLRTAYGMTPEQYRAKWGLPRDYPMVAPGYTAYRSRLAKKIGLGRKSVRTRSR